MVKVFLCVLFLVETASALDVQWNNHTGNPANVGALTVAPGTSRLHWSDSWGNLTVTHGTNYADLGTNGTFEVSLMPTGLDVEVRWGPVEAFQYGLFLAVGQGLSSWLLMAVARKLHPGRAATPEL